MNPILPFDDRDGLIFFNGNYVDWRDAKMHVLSHGLHYASCVFEGTRIYNGKIFRNHDHNLRLQNSAKILDFGLPFSVDEIDDICVQICKKNGVDNGYIRPFAWRGSEQLQISARSTKTQFAAACWPWPAYYKDSAGLRLKVARYRRPAPDSAPFAAKAAGLYMICTLSKHEVEEQGFDEALMLDYRGLIAETSASNLFFVFDNEIHTPTPDCFLNGLTRQTVIGLALELGYKIIERQITIDDLSSANDAFATGTAAEVKKIASVTTADGGRIFNFSDDRVSGRLLSAYRELVNS